MITTATNSAVAALAMSPIDWGLSASAILLVIFAARALVTGEGKAQMGCGFMFVAAAVGTFAIGRQVDGFGLVDGARITVGVLLLVPVFRVLFSHKGSSVTTAVISLLAASVIAGPVVARIFPEHVETGASREVSPIDEEIEGVEQELARKRAALDAIETPMPWRAPPSMSSVSRPPMSSPAARRPSSAGGPTRTCSTIGEDSAPRSRN